MNGSKAYMKEIKSQPDVDEPQRYETKEYAKAKHDTELLHNSDEVV